VLVAWETPESFPDQSPYLLEFARIWKAADKIVYSRTLTSVSSDRTRIEREFDPEAVRRMKAEAERDLVVGGAELAGQAVAAGVVDELHLYLAPIVVGGGTRFLPDGVRVELELEEERRFKGGMVFLRYGTRT
jgi:dihydrofolate reductase